MDPHFEVAGRPPNIVADSRKRETMPPEDVLEALKRRPFEPFRIHLSDGTVYEIHHPDLVMVGLRSLVIGFAASNGRPEPLYERYTTVALSHVVRLGPSEASTSGR